MPKVLTQNQVPDASAKPYRPPVTTENFFNDGQRSVQRPSLKGLSWPCHWTAREIPRNIMSPLTSEQVAAIPGRHFLVHAHLRCGFVRCQHQTAKIPDFIISTDDLARSFERS